MVRALPYCLLVQVFFWGFGCPDPKLPRSVEVEKTVLALSQDDDGDLTYCDEEGRCKSMPNPNGCDVLEVEIYTDSGRTCERCLVEGRSTHHTCDKTQVACTVVTAPEPDCVVCAHIGGHVIHSTCITEPPEYCAARTAVVEGCTSDAHCPASGTCEDGSCVVSCRVCYDVGGREILNECPETGCADVACPPVACADGYVPRHMAGECCEQCVPEDACDENLCSSDIPIPACPEGTQLVRDELDCCYYRCERTQCPKWSEAEVAYRTDQCPPGYRWIVELPECGRCVADNDAWRYCSHTGACSADEICTVDLGACVTPSYCDDGDDRVCTDACYGICRPRDLACPGTEPSTQNESWPSSSTGTDGTAGTAYCEGAWVSAGYDEHGCPLPPVCRCPDGTVSSSGSCRDNCARAECWQIVEWCPFGYVPSYDFPYCCGICVPEDRCAELQEGVSVTGPIPGCPAIDCTTMERIEVDPDTCCPICVRHTEACQTNGDCGIGEVCNAEHGVCVPEATCEDTDGLDPYKPGEVSGVDADGNPFEYQDTCSKDGMAVIEYWCPDVTSGSDHREPGKWPFNCDYGCSDGACQ